MFFSLSHSPIFSLVQILSFSVWICPLTYLQASNLWCTLSGATLCLCAVGRVAVPQHCIGYPASLPNQIEKLQISSCLHSIACIPQFGILVICNLRPTFLCKLFFSSLKVLLSNQANSQSSECTIHICTMNFTLYHSSYLKYPFSDFSYSYISSKQLKCFLCYK